MSNKEPKITVNNILLDEAESMTVRVALQAYAAYLNEPDILGDDDIGKSIAQGYLRNINKINGYIGK